MSLTPYRSNKFRDPRVPEDWYHFVSRVRYKPGFRLSVLPDRVNGDRLHISFETFDSRADPNRISSKLDLGVRTLERDLGLHGYWDEPDTAIPYRMDDLFTMSGPHVAISGSFLLEPYKMFRGDHERLLHVKELLAKFEDHEMAEWLRLDGELIFDPHKER